MPASKKRKPVYPTSTAPAARKNKGPSPFWVAPLMLTLFGVGIAWLVVFYIAQSSMPLVGDLGNANLAIGFAFILLGFAVSTQWR